MTVNHKSAVSIGAKAVQSALRDATSRGKEATYEDIARFVIDAVATPGILVSLLDRVKAALDAAGAPEKDASGIYLGLPERIAALTTAAQQPGMREALDDLRRDTKKLARELQQGLPKRNAAERLEAMSAAADRALAVQPPAAPVETCPRCDGSGLRLNSSGEPDECRECKGNTVVQCSSAENVDTIATLMISEMFADHELPVDEAIFHKYEDLARKILIRITAVPQNALKPIELTEEMLEAGAQALADDAWHPPIKLSQMAKHEANKFKRQALIALKAATAVTRPQLDAGSAPLPSQDGATHG